MSVATTEFKTGGLRFWTQSEIISRQNFIQAILNQLTVSLQSINTAWTFHQTETPILTPRELFSSEYTDKEIFKTDWNKGNSDFYLRAETTAGSYAYAKMLVDQGTYYPLCVWQVGKSFRKEANDGASPAKLRFNEFNQLEFQCIFKDTTKVDYRNEEVLESLAKVVARHTGRPSRLIESDRLPAYSLSTIDIEIELESGEWKEMASCSLRNDFKDGTLVAEFAFGLDRIASFSV